MFDVECILQISVIQWCGEEWIVKSRVKCVTVLCMYYVLYRVHFSVLTCFGVECRVE